jgi:hypothetical protein
MVGGKAERVKKKEKKKINFVSSKKCLKQEL